MKSNIETMGVYINLPLTRTVDRSLQKREEMLKLLKFHMKRAQDRMKQLADRGRSDRSFQIGDLVYVKLHAYRQVSVQARPNAKLAPKYYDPFPVEDKIGAVAYKLKLPLGSMVHNVFHVSQLKKFNGTTIAGNFSPSPLLDTSQKEPAAIIDRMTVKRGNCVVTKVLVQWKHQLPEDATWELCYDSKQKFPHFNP